MRVVVLGAGYAGVTAARRLERSLPDEVAISVVNDTDYHLVQQEIHRLVRRPGLAEEIRLPLTDLFDRAELVEGEVIAVDAEAGRTDLADGRTVEYDLGLLTLGAETAFYDLPGVREHGLPLKSVDHAREIRERFETTMSTGGRAVVGGAGLSGVQVAGELADLAAEEGADVEVTLVEQADRVAPTFPANFAEVLQEELLDHGITIRTGAAVERAEADAVVVDGDRIECDPLVWTGGITADPAVDGDRPVVNRDLRLTENTFAAGDAARVVDANGRAVPAAAQTAIRQAPVAADNVAALVDHRLNNPEDFEPRLESYTYTDLGWAVSVGNGAVSQVGPTVLRGRPAKAIKTTIGAGYLSTIGAVREAVDLVNEELGIADAVHSDPSDAPEGPVEVDIDVDAGDESDR